MNYDYGAYSGALYIYMYCIFVEYTVIFIQAVSVGAPMNRVITTPGKPIYFRPFIGV